MENPQIPSNPNIPNTHYSQIPPDGSFVVVERHFIPTHIYNQIYNFNQYPIYFQPPPLHPLEPRPASEIPPQINHQQQLQPPQPPQPQQQQLPIAINPDQIRVSGISQDNLQEILNSAPPEILELIQQAIRTGSGVEMHVSGISGGPANIPQIIRINRASNIPDTIPIPTDDDDVSSSEAPHYLNFSELNKVSNLGRHCDINETLSTKVEECSVCQDNFTGSEIVRHLKGCNHVFHVPCIDTWLNSNYTCPVCRHNLNEDLVNNDHSESESNPEYDPESEHQSSDSESDPESCNESDHSDNDNSSIDLDSQGNCRCSKCNNPEPSIHPDTHRTTYTSRTYSSLSEAIHDVQNNLTNIIANGAPIINTFIASATSNAGPEINAADINSNFSDIMNSINPLITLIDDLRNLSFQPSNTNPNNNPDTNPDTNPE